MLVKKDWYAAQPKLDTSDLYKQVRTHEKLVEAEIVFGIVRGIQSPRRWGQVVVIQDDFECEIQDHVQSLGFEV